MGFVANTVTITSGLMAERATSVLSRGLGLIRVGRTSAYVLLAILLSSFIIPVVFHWVWAPTGWLLKGISGYPFLDFAGSAPVHMAGATAGLIASKVLGPR